MLLNFFSKAPIPSEVPSDIKPIVSKLKKCKTKKEVLQKALNYISENYHSSRYRTYTKIWRLFYHLDAIWKCNDFLHCNHTNYLFMILVVKSGFFKLEDITLHWTLVWYVSPHQYMSIRLSDEESIFVDTWGNSYGVKLGDYAHGFYKSK